MTWTWQTGSARWYYPSRNWLVVSAFLAIPGWRFQAMWCPCLRRCTNCRSLGHHLKPPRDLVQPHRPFRPSYDSVLIAHATRDCRCLPGKPLRTLTRPHSLLMHGSENDSGFFSPALLHSHPAVKLESENGDNHTERHSAGLDDRTIQHHAQDTSHTAYISGYSEVFTFLFFLNYILKLEQTKLTSSFTYLFS